MEEKQFKELKESVKQMKEMEKLPRLSDIDTRLGIRNKRCKCGMVFHYLDKHSEKGWEEPEKCGYCGEDR